MNIFRCTPRILLAMMVLAVCISPPAYAAGPTISGEGSSFVLLEVAQWTADTKLNPYNLDVNYLGTSSGQGRLRFKEKAVDFGMSDIPYDPNDKPGFPFAYVPVSAGGMAFMFNVHDKSDRQIKDLKLTPETACAIFTGEIKRWTDPKILKDNPKLAGGVKKDQIKLVLRQGAAGTSFILGQYCLKLAPDVWSRFIELAKGYDTGVNPNTGFDGAPGPPIGQWPFCQTCGNLSYLGSDQTADYVANAATGESSICVVETGFAKLRSVPVASVKNAAGVFIQPTEAAVTTALGYAGDDPRGTQMLVFDPPDPKAYNPSTYSYALVRLDSAVGAEKGKVLAQFLNFAVGKGQEKATLLKYSPLPQNLVDQAFTIIAQIPGAPPKESFKAVPVEGTADQPEVDPDPPSTDPTTTTIATGGSNNGGGDAPSSNSGAADTNGGNIGGATTGVAGGGADGIDPSSGGQTEPVAAVANSGGSSAVLPATVKPGTSTPVGKASSVTTARPKASDQIAAPSQVGGVFPEQSPDRSPESDSIVPLGWVLALGASGYFFAKRSAGSASRA